VPFRSTPWFGRSPSGIVPSYNGQCREAKRFTGQIGRSGRFSALEWPKWPQKGFGREVFGTFSGESRELLPDRREVFPMVTGSFSPTGRELLGTKVVEKLPYRSAVPGRTLAVSRSAKRTPAPPRKEPTMPHDGGNDRQLAGSEGFDDLLVRLDPVILSVVGRFARDGDTADELAQTCRIRIYERQGQCRDPEAIFGWARTLCRRVCITAAGAERQERDGVDEYDDGTAAVESSVPDPLASVEAGEVRRRVRTAVERLPAEQRRLLMLRYWHGLSSVEIARRVNLPAATVRTRLRRACLRLRRAPEIVCYAPRRVSLWSRDPRDDTD